MLFSRRRFLQAGGALATAFLVPSVPRLARAAVGDAVLVVVYLRGAADGLNLVVPAGDPAYYSLRPDIQVAPAEQLDLDGFYALHPSLAPLEPLYRDGDLAIVHAAGSPDPSRSHFDAQDFMERAAPGDPGVTDGWLNRTLGRLGASDSWAGISIGAARALALSGDAASLAFGSIEEFALQGATGQRPALESMYLGASPTDLERAASEAFAALDVIGAVAPGEASSYPPGPYGAALADAAALIRADTGVRLLSIDVGGWDHHESEAAAMDPVAALLSSGLAAFRSDLGQDWDRTCVLVMTEFGRTAQQNGSQGTDHGHGSVMFALGGGVDGGRIVTRDDVWPGLGPADLFEGRDLAVTTDFRDVFGEVLNRHIGLSLADLADVLPGHSVAVGDFPGLFAS